MQDSGNLSVYMVEAGNKDGIRKTPFPPFLRENLSVKEKQKMRSIFDGILGILNVAGASNNGKGWTAWAFDLASSILG